MKKISMLIVCSLIFLSCKKDNEKCDYYPQSKINVYNGVDYTYYIYLDGNLLGKAYHNTTTQDYNNYFTVSPGNHTLKIEMMNVPANSKTSNINTVQCETLKVTTI